MAGAVRVHKSSAAQQVVQILTERIRSGEYAPEARLPSEDALGLELGVSRTTIRSALDVLATQSMVLRRHGVGTFVSTLSGIANPLTQAVHFQDLIRASGYEPGIRWLSSGLIQADLEMAKALNRVAGDPIFEVRKEFTADGEPVIYCVNYIPEWVLGGDLLKRLVAKPDMEEPLFEFVAGACGHPISHFVASIWPEMIGDSGFDVGELDPITPALVIDEVGYDTQERPVLRSVHHYPGRYMSFVFIRRFQGDPLAPR